MATRDRKHLRLAHYVPAVGWLPRYERRWPRGDLTAGIAVTALVVPKNLGYAGIAGVPPQNGLYAAGDETFPGIAVVRLDGGLFFTTAEALEDRVQELTENNKLALWCSISRASISSTRRERRS